jgi:hypothetical protein
MKQENVHIKKIGTVKQSAQGSSNPVCKAQFTGMHGKRLSLDMVFLLSDTYAFFISNVYKI